MAVNLRFVLIVFSVLTAFFVLRKIRKAQMQISDSLFWIIFIGILVILSIFPQIANYACKWVGVMAPVNFVFLAIIFLLLIKCFLLSLKLSVLENKFQNFVQEYAIQRNFDEKDNDMEMFHIDRKD